MATRYDTDFHAWTQEQAAKLRALLAERANLDLDFENIAEEIDSLGRSNRRQLINRLEELDNHLLKLAFSLAWEPRRQWKNSVRGQRIDIADLLEESPSLRPILSEALIKAHHRAVRSFDDQKLIELTMPLLPSTCPFELDQMLDPDWWPDPRAAD